VTDPRRAVILGVVLIVTANLMGGLAYPMQKLALRGLPPVTLMLVRNLVGVALMMALVAFRGTDWKRWDRRDFVRVFVLGTFAYGLPMLLGIVGVGMSTASNGSILVLLEPAVIVVIAWLCLKERVSAVKLLAVAFGLAGAVTIVLEDASLDELFGGEHLAGNAILALHGVLWGVYTPFIKPIVARRDPIGISALTLAFAIPPFVPLAALEWSKWQLDAAGVEALAWGVGLGVFSSFGATLLWLISLRFLSASTTAPFVFLQPLAGIGAGMMFLGEGLTPASITGAILIAIGVVLATRRGGE